MWVLKEHLLDQEIPSEFDNWQEGLLLLRYDAEVWVHEFED